MNHDGSYLWGDLLNLELNEDVRIINLEAAPTISINNPDIPRKERTRIHYHVNINNLPRLFSRFTHPYVLCLANNHSLDMGLTALITETIPNMPNSVGIGINYSQAYSPIIIGKCAIFAFGAGCSGIPSNWAAGSNKAGIAYLPPILNENNVVQAFEIIKLIVTEHIQIQNLCVVISIHWGPNWAETNDGQIYREKLAHRLIDELGVDLIHGHSSHHIRGLELYKNRLIIYGAGDFINDYEQISHNDNYDTAGALFVVDLDGQTFQLQQLLFIPFEIKQLQCRMITDPSRIKMLKGFINKQSIRDSEIPILLL